VTDSFVKHLFLGELRADLLRPFPALDEPGRELLDVFRDSLQRFAALRIDSRAIDKAHRIPREVVEGLKELGLFGLRVPEEIRRPRPGHDAVRQGGGRARGARRRGGDHVRRAQHDRLKALLLHGSREQKRRCLPRLATGELRAAFALSEPGAGSDAQSLRTTARRAPDGGYVLNGEKLWITNGGFAELSRSSRARPTTRAPTAGPRSRCFIVERASGFRSGPEEDKLGITGSSTVPLFFEDVRVPADNLLAAGRRLPHRARGPQRRAHRPRGSCLGLCRFLLGRSRPTSSSASSSAGPLADFELIAEKLARMAQERTPSSA
jgi:alkylation response protein AidB-like acyl-CoA dehydrogenase